MLLAAVSVAYVMSALDFKAGFILYVVLVGAPLLVYGLFNLTFSIGLMLLAALMVPFAARFTDAPVGVLLDLFVLTGATGVLLRQVRERDWSFARSPLSYMVIIWLYYNVMQVVNPAAESKMTWLYTIRGVAIQLTVFFIGAYAFRHNRQGAFTVVKTIMVFCFLGALYGLKQQLFGFGDAEKSWVMADPERFQLYFRWNRMGVPSFCYDPASFGILMACFAVFCLALIPAAAGRQQKWWLSAMFFCALGAMVCSGDRFAFVLAPLGAIFYAGLFLNWRVLLIGGVFVVLGTGFVLKSTSSGVISRIQSVFKPVHDDPGNEHLKIQPFIRNHALGGGLGSCGVWEKRFNPESELAKFPHESSFVRVGVELGWIGLILYVLLHYVALHTGLYYFIRCRDPLIKALYAGITSWVFMLAVACYFREGIEQLPMNVVYNVLLALLLTLKNFDPAGRGGES